MAFFQDSPKVDPTKQAPTKAAPAKPEVSNKIETPTVEQLRELHQATVAAGKTLVVYFKASWCKPCEGYTPKVEASFRALDPKKVTVAVVDLSSEEQHAEAGVRMGISELPAILTYKKGTRLNEPTERKVGVRTDEEIKALAQ
jgi:thiol-disulfide isomerase/thioredoxin